MKPYTLLFALWIALASAAMAGTWNTQQVFMSSGSNDVPFVGYSESGASAGEFNQDTHFNSPTITISRSGTTGGEIASAPIVLVQASQETTGTSPVLQVGGCAALSGDNWFIEWGDGSLSIPGGFLDNTNKVHGHLSVDPVHRQLLAEDGVTPVLIWTGTETQVGNLVVTGSFTVPAGFTERFAPATSAVQAGSSSAPGLAVTVSGTTLTITGTATNSLYLTASSSLNAANVSGALNLAGLTISGTLPVGNLPSIPGSTVTGTVPAASVAPWSGLTGNPLAGYAGTAFAWCSPLITFSASSSVIVTASNTFCVARIPVSVTTGTGPFVASITLSGSNAVPGAMVRVCADFSADNNGTLNIYDSASGELISSGNNPFPTSLSFLWQVFGFDGTNWRKEDAEWQPGGGF